MEKVAVLVDGAFMLNRLRRLKEGPDIEPEKMAGLIWGYCLRHVDHAGKEPFELYRIFFYDCPPLSKKVHLPVSNKAFDFGKDNKGVWRGNLHQELRQKRKVALRLGYLDDTNGWRIKDRVVDSLRKGEKFWEDLTDEDWHYAARQKGVDARIAVDIASLSFKHQVARIVLIAGDADFVPAAKLARREGIDFILDPLFNPIKPDLHEHIDGCHSKWKRDRKRYPEEAYSLDPAQKV